jgi:hypothetical protein
MNLREQQRERQILLDASSMERLKSVDESRSKMLRSEISREQFQSILTDAAESQKRALEAVLFWNERNPEYMVGISEIDRWHEEMETLFGTAQSDALVRPASEELPSSSLTPGG